MKYFTKIKSYSTKLYIAPLTKSDTVSHFGWYNPKKGQCAYACWKFFIFPQLFSLDSHTTDSAQIFTGLFHVNVCSHKLCDYCVSYQLCNPVWNHLWSRNAIWHFIYTVIGLSYYPARAMEVSTASHGWTPQLEKKKRKTIIFILRSFLDYTEGAFTFKSLKGIGKHGCECNMFHLRLCSPLSRFYGKLLIPNRPLSRCGHLDFTQFQLIATKLRLDEITVWCHVCAMNVSIHYCYGNREHDQDGVYISVW